MEICKYNKNRTICTQNADYINAGLHNFAPENTEPFFYVGCSQDQSSSLHPVRDCSQLMVKRNRIVAGNEKFIGTKREFSVWEMVPLFIHSNGRYGVDSSNCIIFCKF